MRNSKRTVCACGSAPKLIFPCSGGSDVGEITDRAARKLTRQGKGRMYCLAGVGGRVSGIMATTAAAAKLLAIDGCPLGCAGKTLEQAGFAKYEHLVLSELGMPKGETRPTPANIAKVATAAASRLA